MSPVGERFLVTGALGCIGAWTVRTLVREGAPVIGFDLGNDTRRLEQIMQPDELAQVQLVTGDITDLGALERVLDEDEITNVIHLAALQVPFCRADPPLGAQVNVTGTVNVFEAVRRQGRLAAPVIYTGSIGMFSPGDADPQTGRLEEDATAHPGNHYGVYKLANEGNARVFWADSGVASVGVRPMTVFGAGRDQGMTSSPTAAIAAAVLGISFRISFTGTTLFQYAEDVARTLILASRSEPSGPRVFNLGGSRVALTDWISAIDEAVPGAAAHLSLADAELPFPSDIAHDRLAELGSVPVTPYREAIAATADIYRNLAARGRLMPEHHGVTPALTPSSPSIA